MPHSLPLPWPEDALAEHGLASPPDSTRTHAWAKVATAGVWLVAMAVLSRAMHPKDYGVFQQAWLVTSTFAAILAAGLPGVCFALLPGANRARGQQIVWFSIAAAIGISAPIATLFWLFPTVPKFLAQAWRPNYPLRDAAFGIGMLTVALAPGFLFAPMLAAIRAPRIALAAAQIALWAVLSILAVSLGGRADLGTLFLAMAGAGLAQILGLCLWAQMRYGLWTPSMDSGVLAKLAGLAALAGPAAALDIVACQIDRFVVSQRFGAEGLAMYANGAIPFVAATIWLHGAPPLAGARIRHKLKSGSVLEAASIWRGVLSRRIRWSLPLFFYLAIFGPLWVRALFGAEYAASGFLFSIYSLLLPLSLYTSGFAAGAGGFDPLAIRARAMHLTLAFVLALGLSATPLGVYGAAIGAVLGCAAGQIYFLLLHAQRLRVGWRVWMPLRESVALAIWSGGGGAAAYLAASLCPRDWVVARLVIGAAIYFAWSLVGLLKWGPRTKDTQ